MLLAFLIVVALTLFCVYLVVTAMSGLVEP